MTYLTIDKSDSLALERSDTTEGTLAGSGMFVAIDPRVDNYNNLAQGVLPGAEVLVMDLGKDGVAQITAALQARRNSLTSIHIISHGEVGKVQLGSNWLGADNLDGYAPQLAEWAQAFAGKAEILLYGCNVAGDETGMSLIWRLSELTGATVAASNNLTGNAAQGGDWNLQVSTGKVNAGLALTEEVRESYQGVFGVPTVTSFKLISPTTQDFTAAAATATITNGPAVYEITFSEPVVTSSLIPSDFAVPGTGASVVSVQANPSGASATVFNVVVQIPTSNTVLNLDPAAGATITDAATNTATNPLPALPNDTVNASDATPPTILSFGPATPSATNSTQTISIPVVFSEPVNATSLLAALQYSTDNGVTIAAASGATTPVSTDADASTFTITIPKDAVNANTHALGILAGTVKDSAGNFEATGKAIASGNEVFWTNNIAPTATGALATGAINTITPGNLVTTITGTYADAGNVGGTVLPAEINADDIVIIHNGAVYTGATFTQTAGAATGGAPLATTQPADYTITFPATLTSTDNGVYSVYVKQGGVSDNGGTNALDKATLTGTILSVPGVDTTSAATIDSSITAGAVKLQDITVLILPPPTVNITRVTTANPNNLDNVLNPGTLDYKVIFSEALTAAADTALTGAATAPTFFTLTVAGNPALTTAPSIASVAKDLTTDPTGKTYTVKVNPSTGTFDGTIQLNFANDAANTIKGAVSTLPVTPAVSGPGYTVDRVQPVATFIPPVTSPNKGVTPLTGTLKFSEPVTGVDTVGMTDLKISNGAVITAVTPVAGSTTDYTVTIGNATLATGNYTIDLLDNGNIKDLVGNKLLAPISSSFGVDSNFPIPVIGTVPSPAKSAAFNAVPITFSEAVASGFDVNKFSLTKPDSTVLTTIDGLTPATLPNSSFTLDLSNEATTDGTYTLSLVQQGATDAIGNANTNATPVTATFTVDNTAPTASVTEVKPDPTNVGVPDNTVFVNFSEPVKGFDAGDLRLNGAAITGTPVVTQVTSSQWKISGISTPTATAGTYTLTVDNTAASGITDVASNPLGTVTPESWVVDTTPPTAVIDPVATPTDMPVDSVTVRFNETVKFATADLANVTLTLPDGTKSPLTGATVVPVDAATGVYRIEGLGASTLTNGAYSITLNGVKDLAGNAQTAPAPTVVWTEAITNPVGVIQAVSPNPTKTPVTTLNILFNYPVAGFDLKDLTLDGAALPAGATLVTNTGAVADGTPTASGYTLTLPAQTDGKHDLKLVAATSGITDPFSGKALATPDPISSWTLDTLLPTVALPTVPNQTNQPVSSIPIPFSESVTGFDIADLVLTRDGAPVDLVAAGATLTPTGPGPSSSYTLGNLGTATSQPGAYVLKLTDVAPNINDPAQNALDAAKSTLQTTWGITATNPLVTIEPITPNPTNKVVTSFKAVFASQVKGVDAPDFELSKNGVVKKLSAIPGATVTAPVQPDTNYTITVPAAETTGDGDYTLTLKSAGSGITNSVGTALTTPDAAVNWKVDTTLPTVALPTVPDQVNQPISSIPIPFSEGVTGFDITDLVLTRDGAPVDLKAAGATLTPAAGPGSSYTLGNLGTATSQPGAYVLKLTDVAPNINDPAQNALDAAKSTLQTTWKITGTNPLVTIEPITPNPTNKVVTSFKAVFASQVKGVDAPDFELSKNGVVKKLSAIPGATVTAPVQPDTNYTITVPAAETTGDGDYTLTLVSTGSGITNSVGTALTTPDAAVNWKVDTTLPTVTIPPVPNQANQPVSSIPITFSEGVKNFDLSDLVLTLDGTPVDLKAAGATLTPAVGPGSGYTLGNLGTATSKPGTYVLKLADVAPNITDPAQNALDLTKSTPQTTWSTKATNPFVVIEPVTPNPTNQPVTNFNAVFASQVQGVDTADFVLSKDGGATGKKLSDITGATITPPVQPDTNYTITVPAAETTGEGDYKLTLVSAGSGITNNLGTALAGPDAAVTWKGDFTLPTATIGAVADTTGAGVPSVTVKFTEPVTGVDIGDFILTLDGAAVPLTGATVTKTDDANYTITGLDPITLTSGQYQLSLIAGPSGIKDGVANLLTADATTAWKNNASVVVPTPTPSIPLPPTPTPVVPTPTPAPTPTPDPVPTPTPAPTPSPTPTPGPTPTPAPTQSPAVTELENLCATLESNLNSTLGTSTSKSNPTSSLDLKGTDNNDAFQGTSNAENLLGLGGNDTLVGLGGDDNLYGGNGGPSVNGSDEDSLLGSGGNDYIRGESGKDTIYGGKENDYLFGDTEDDNIFGDNGNDIISGGKGSDQIRGGKENDVIGGDEGNDIISGDLGVDSITGGAGNDTILGGNGDPANTDTTEADVLLGGSGDDVIAGFGGRDILCGDAGNDALSGGNEEDTLIGGSGNDTLDGGSGSNTLAGGAGTDIFLLSNAGNGSNTILDLNRSEGDKILLTGGLTFQQLSFSPGGNGAINVRANNNLVATVSGVLNLGQIDFII